MKNMRRLNAGVLAVAAAAVLVLAAAWSAQADQTNDYVHFRLGVKYQRDQRFEQAVEEFRKVLAAYPDNYNAYMHLAEIRRSQGQSRLAVHNLKKALAYNPGWGKAHRMLAQTYAEDGQYQNAVMELQLYQQTCDPAERDSIQSEINRLLTITAGGKVERSLDASGQDSVALHRAAVGSARPPDQKSRGKLSTSPAAQAEFAAGVRLYGEQKFDEASERFRKCLAVQPGHAGAYYYAGLIRRRAGQNHLAKINFLKALSYPELGYNAHFYLGKIYGEEKDYSDAIRHLESYIKVSDYEAGKEEARRLIAGYRGLASDSSGGPPPVDIAGIGRQELRSEIEKIDPESLPSTMEIRLDSVLSMIIVDTLTDAGRNMLAGVRAFAEGKYDAAVREFKNTLIERPTGASAPYCSYNSGICYMRMRLFPRAENQFQHILDKFPAHTLASRSLFLKALSYTERKETTVGEKLFRSFIASHRDHPWIGKAYEKLGDAYLHLEQTGKAVDAYQQAAALAAEERDRVYAFYKLGSSYLVMDNPKRGLEALRKAIETGARHSVYERVPDSHYRMADHYYQTKQFREALAAYTTVTRTFPHFQETPWGLFQIGNTYRNLKEYQKAIGAYKELIESHAEDYWAKQARWRMDDAVWEYEYQAALR